MPETKTVGSGISERKNTRTFYQLKDLGNLDGPPNLEECELAAAALQSGIDNAKLPWRGKTDWIENIRCFNESYLQEAPDWDDIEAYNKFYAPRETEAWYFRELVTRIGILEDAVRDLRIWDAVDDAMIIGDLITELCIKHDWEEGAVFGRKQLAQLREEAEKKRNNTMKERYEAVVHFLNNAKRADGTGVSVRRALELAAADLDSGKSTVGNDYFQYKRELKNRTEPID